MIYLKIKNLILKISTRPLSQIIIPYSLFLIPALALVILPLPSFAAPGYLVSGTCVAGTVPPAVGAVPCDTSTVGSGPPTTLTALVNKILGLINQTIPFLIGLGLLGFLIGVFKYITAGADSKKLASGRDVIIYGLLALFFMLSFWGLAKIVQTSLGF